MFQFHVTATVAGTKEAKCRAIKFKVVIAKARRREKARVPYAKVATWDENSAASPVPALKSSHKFLRYAERVLFRHWTSFTPIGENTICPSSIRLLFINALLFSLYLSFRVFISIRQPCIYRSFSLLRGIFKKEAFDYERDDDGINSSRIIEIHEDYLGVRSMSRIMSFSAWKVTFRKPWTQLSALGGRARSMVIL